MAQVMDKVNNYIYVLDNKIYVNLTNACTNNCLFCIRNQKDDVKGTDMRISEHPDFNTVIEQLKQKEGIIGNGVTFCGYGEPLLEFDLVTKIAEYIKENYPSVKIKINTNGHANAVFKKDIVPSLKGIIDEVSISLNAHDEKIYNELCMPKVENAYNEMLDFAKKCVENGIKTTMTVVTNFKSCDIDIKKCRLIAKNIGAELRLRPFIENGY